MSEIVTKQDVDVYMGPVLDFESEEVRGTKTYENYSKMFFTEGDKQYVIMYLDGKWSEPILIATLSTQTTLSEPRTFQAISEISPLSSGYFHVKETIQLMKLYADACVAKKLIDMGYRDYVDGDPESDLAEIHMLPWFRENED